MFLSMFLLLILKLEKFVSHKLISDILGGPLHMDEQMQDDQLEPLYNSSVPIQDIALKTLWEQWNRDGWRERFRDIRADSATW